VRLLSLPLLVLGVVAMACGSPEGAGPRGVPAAVVGRAPDVTIAAGRAQVTGAAAGVHATGSLDLRTGTPQVAVKGHRPPNPFLTDPALALDVVRGRVRIVPYGGVEVQGVGTIKYELDVDPARVLAAAPTDRRDRLAKVLPSGRFYADVFIDTAGRIRRVLLPADLSVPRQYGKSKVTNEEMTVDFYAFGNER
jgi:hypothetical protein